MERLVTIDSTSEARREATAVHRDDEGVDGHGPADSRTGMR